MIATATTLALLLLGVLLTEVAPLLRSLPAAVLRPREYLVVPVWTAPCCLTTKSWKAQPKIRLSSFWM